MRQLVLVQLKAFGDLVIACSIAGRVVERSEIAFLIGSHLRELYEALNPPIDRIEIDVGQGGVPAIFDMRTNGVLEGARSAWCLRRKIARSGLAPHQLLLFERGSARERFLSGSFATTTLLPGTANIYQGYVARLRAAGLTLFPEPGFSGDWNGPVGIFPGSRMTAKNLPLPLVAEISADLERRCLPSMLFLLSGERPDLERSDMPHTIVPRRFAAMLNAVRSCRAVIAADSMPAHLAEAAAVPVFVFSPRQNEYWLPQSAFERRRWEVFSQGANSPQFLDWLAS